MSNKTDIIVFLGPSLSVTEAQKILPNAAYLPPVECGDIFRALRLKPKVIAIIDGFFQNTAAVWHKEILYAIEKGIKVYGASSMGALRGAELADLGMIGVGKVFQAYYSGEINDDDEVAVLHRPEQSDFASISDAMINIRETLSVAKSQNLIDEKTQKLILKHAKQLYYPKRTLKKAIELTIQDQGDSQQLQALNDWLNADNYVNQKKLDAIELLQLLAKQSFPAERSATSNTQVHRSLYLRTLQQQVMCSAMPYYRDWLPPVEKKLIEKKESGTDYTIIQEISQLYASADAIAAKLDFALENKVYDQFHYPEFAIHMNANWCKENDVTKQEAKQIHQRLARIDNLLNAYEEQMTQQVMDTTDYLLMMLRMSGVYKKYAGKDVINTYQQQNSQHFHLLKIKCMLWRFIDFYAESRQLQPHIDSIQQYSNEFREKHGIATKETTQQWLKDNDIDLVTYHKMMLRASRYDYLINKHNVDPLGIHCADDVCWILDVARVFLFD